MRILVEETEFALESVLSLSIELKGLKMRPEVVQTWRVFVSEPTVLKSTSG